MHLRTLLHFLPVLCAVSCAEPGLECSELATATNPIKFATPDAGVHPLAATGALFALRTRSLELDDSPAEHVCTATRLDASTFLTARHCTVGYAPHALELAPAPRTEARRTVDCLDSDTEQPEGLAVVRILEHESLDLALAFTAEPDTAKPEPTERDSMHLATSAPAPGDILLLAGFGLTERSELGELRALEATVLDVTADTVTIQGIGGGACVGDSGGPLFSLDGTLALYGVLSTGSASCLGRDYYVNLHAAGEWLDAQLP